MSSNKLIEVDRLSELPDSLIIRILSLLEVKQSAVTAVLSKRWRFLWRDSPRLVFRETSRSKDNVRGFVSRVNRTLIAISGCRNGFETFEVDFFYSNFLYSLDVDVWLDFAVRNRVKHLSLLLHTSPPNKLNVYSLPQTTFHNPNFKRLTLERCVVGPRGAIEWPSLTSLHIGHVELQQHLIENILSGCPVLQSLCLQYCWGFSRLEVETKSLCLLQVGYPRNGLNDNEPLLRISAPGVRTLWVSLQAKGKKLSLGNMPSLSWANIGYTGAGWETNSKEVMDNAEELLEKTRHVKNVKTRGFYNEVLSSLAMTGYQFPQSTRDFLWINAPAEKRSLHGILGLLESSPTLEALVIDVCFFGGTSICPDPKGDLNCDLLHLKTITLKNFVHPSLDGEPMLTLARILLKRAPMLAKMVVNIEGIAFTTSEELPALSEHLKIAQTLLSYPRSSTKAIIILS